MKDIIGWTNDREAQTSSIKLHFASQVIVQKQQMYLGAKRTPPGKSVRALQPPRARARCGCFTTCTGHGGNSSKRLLKDRPTQADQQIPNQTTAVGRPNPVLISMAFG
jgi:hypothetical protein